MSYAGGVYSWLPVVVGLVIIIWANWEWIKGKASFALNPIVPLPKAATYMRKAFRGPIEKLVEQNATDVDGVQNWFATYVSMYAPILGKGPTSIELQRVPKGALAQGRITDGGSLITTYGGQQSYTALAVRYRDLRSAIKKMGQEFDDGAG